MGLGGLRKVPGRELRQQTQWNELWTSGSIPSPLLAHLTLVAQYLLDAYSGPRLGARILTVTKTDTVPTLTEISKEDKDKTSNYTKVKESSDQGMCQGGGE